MSFSLASNRPVEEKKQHPQFGVESDQHEDDDQFGWRDMPDDLLEEKMSAHEDERSFPITPRRDDAPEENKSNGNDEAGRMETMSDSVLGEKVWSVEEEEPDIIFKRPPGTIMDALSVINLAWQYTRDRDNRMRRRELQEHNNNRVQGGDEVHPANLSEFLSSTPN